MENAHRMFRFRFQHLQEASPALIMMSTDGYSNSFSSDADFHKVGPDLLRILRTDGPQEVSGLLAGWLSEASAKGSGDDVTLGVIYNLGTAAANADASPDAARPAPPVP